MRSPSPKLTNPDSPTVRAALARQCPSCKAQPGDRCVIGAGPMKGKPLTIRVVHYARVTFKCEVAR